MTTATVGSRYQIVIPRAERAKIGLKPAEKVEVHAQNGQLVITPARGRKSWYGIGRELHDGTDATDYVRKLREEWKSRP